MFSNLFCLLDMGNSLIHDIFVITFWSQKVRLFSKIFNIILLSSTLAGFLTMGSIFLL
jgi:hypothetical protein